MTSSQRIGEQRLFEEGGLHSTEYHQHRACRSVSDEGSGFHGRSRILCCAMMNILQVISIVDYSFFYGSNYFQTFSHCFLSCGYGCGYGSMSHGGAVDRTKFLVVGCEHVRRILARYELLDLSVLQQRATQTLG